MSRCEDFEVAISLRAAGGLDANEAAGLEAHLAECPACRAEAARADEALALAKLPPVDEAERRALADLPARTLDGLRRSERRRHLGKRVVAGVIAAAAAAAFVLAPAVLRKAPTAPSPEELATRSEAAWEAPDLDDLWEDAQLVDTETSAVTSSDGADAAVAALDY